MDSTPAITTLAPSSSTAETRVSAIPLERQVGKAVAMAASAVAAGVRDYASGGVMTVATKKRVANLFGELYTLRSLMVGTWDFDAIAHQHGRLALAEACGGVNAGEQAIVDELINTVMDVLRKVARSQTN